MPAERSLSVGNLSSRAPYTRVFLETTPTHVPGDPAPRLPRGRSYKISSNENPFPPLPSVLDAIARASSQVNRYPDLLSRELVQELAGHFGVPPGHICVGTGSVGVLSQIVRATCDPGDEVVYAWRSFEAYPHLAAASGVKSVQVPLSPGYRHDLEAMADAVTARTRLIIICSPNNPTGTTVHHDELTAFLDAVPPDVAVVIDEAYTEFDCDPNAANAMTLHDARPNVVMVRTFSKAHGLAALRVGFAVAHPSLVAALSKTAVPFGVSSLAQEAAIASLHAPEEMAARVEEIMAERRRVESALRAQGWRLPDSQGNFVWLPLGRCTADFALACRQAGLSERSFPGEGARSMPGR